MWPWEHAVVGYIAFSLIVHFFLRRSPTGREAVVVVFASVFPDIIDKPLAWQFGIFESGYALGHSIFFAVSLFIVVFLVTTYYQRVNLGGAFGVGYLLHLPFDVLPKYVQYGSLPIGILLWPLEKTESSSEGFSEMFVYYFTDYISEILSSESSGYMIAVMGTIAFCILLWTYDGMPGFREPITYVWKQISR